MAECVDKDGTRRIIAWSMKKLSRDTENIVKANATLLEVRATKKLSLLKLHIPSDSQIITNVVMNRGACF